MIINKATAILSLVPGAEVTVYGHGADAEVLWISPSTAPVTDEQIAAEMIRLQAEYNAKEYQRLRAKEYPPVEMYLDAVVKGDQEQMQAYIDACLAVKAKYPKPEGV